MSEKMMEKYSQILKLLDMSGGACDYQYVCSLRVNVSDINTSSIPRKLDTWTNGSLNTCIQYNQAI